MWTVGDGRAQPNNIADGPSASTVFSDLFEERIYLLKTKINNLLYVVFDNLNIKLEWHTMRL